ncbi:C7orf57 [Branchiostoma lanceolatum]|uniref:C7orf57 protein n=1 Tax=Branchiostoma lanceolatum TaxID=7740 RepID=A0A8K0EFE3_BRALA|nr:C7orf57 [Branchiostoma lanceolatum]
MSLTKRRPGDEDWFYHAPLKSKKDSAQVSVPPASQIPGLSQMPADPLDIDPAAKRKWIRDTDTKYIKLAKQGGRQDLLRYRSPPDRTKGPVPYPRVDWFDHDMPQEEDEPLPHTFALPEYMVHEEFTPSPQRQQEGRKKAPFSTDNKTVWQRDDTDPTDKRIRLPEIKRPQRRHNVKEKMPPPNVDLKKERRKQPAALKDHFAPKSRFPPVPHQGKEEPVAFGKLLSMGYQRDWISERNDQEERHTHGARQLEPLTKGTEYQDRISKQQISGNKHPHKPTRKDAPGHKGSAGSLGSGEKPVFKLSKFEKVGPKVSTRREPVHV